MGISAIESNKQYSNKYVDVVYDRRSYNFAVTCKSRNRIIMVMSMLYSYGLSFDVSWLAGSHNYGKVKFQVPVFVGHDSDRQALSNKILDELLDGKVE